jgi:hypothetical protein
LQVFFLGITWVGGGGDDDDDGGGGGGDNNGKALLFPMLEI